MSIATALTALADDVSAAKAAITAKGGTAPNGTADMADAIAAIPSGGITPTGNINITDTSVTDVTNYATAQVVSENLKAENIKKNIDILGVIGSFEGGGATITDGIVVKARDANGYATEIDFYGTTIETYQLGGYNANTSPWVYLNTINFKNAVTIIKNNGLSYVGNKATTTEFSLPESITTLKSGGCYGLKITNINLPNLVTLEQQAFVSCTAVSVNVPKLTNIPAYGFASLLNLQSIQIGSIGYGITRTGGTNIFNNDRQVGLVVTAFCNGSFADALLNAIRMGATNATIIIKASEATTYGGTSYAAGDTMITSTP